MYPIILSLRSWGVFIPARFSLWLKAAPGLANSLPLLSAQAEWATDIREVTWIKNGKGLQGIGGAPIAPNTGISPCYR